MWINSPESAEQVNAIANNALIALGLLGALATFFVVKSGSEMQRYSDIEIARARADAAKANERAAELTLETEQLREKMAWRRLTPDQVLLITQSFRGFPFPITVSDLQGDPESTTYGEDITAALKRAGVAVKQEDLVYAGGPPPIGLLVTHTPDGNGDKVATNLSEAGVSIIGRSPSDSVVIIVGTKPRPL
jgi:hypothetical protein